MSFHILVFGEQGGNNVKSKTFLSPGEEERQGDGNFWYLL